MKQGNVNLEQLKKHSFHITGTVDTLTGVYNTLAFVLAERKKIEALFPDGYLLYSCEHCHVAMQAMLITIEEIIKDAISKEEKGGGHVIN